MKYLNSQKGIASIILVLILAVIIVGVGVYVLGNKKSQPMAQKVVVQPTPTPVDETANWKTYKNDKYGFEIKYPQDWQVETTNNDSFIKLYNIAIDKQYKDSAKKILTEGSAFNNGLYIDVVETNKTLEDFIQSLYNDPNSPHGNTIKSTKNVKLPNGMSAIFVESNTSGYGLDSATLLKFKNYIFSFTKHYGGSFGLEKYTDQQFDQIFSTFQFSN